MTVKTASDGGFELDWSAMDRTTKDEFEALFEQSERITVDPRAPERKFTVPERNRAMVREFRDCFEKGFMGKDGVRRTPTWGKTIVFGVTRHHAETLAAMFDEHFADLKPDPVTRFADFVISGLGGGPAPDAGTIIKRFKEEQFPQILVSVNMLDTGFDCPEVVNLVMARFTRSAILYRQMRGRDTRKADHIGKTDFTMFDFVGVTDYHGDDEEDVAGGVMDGKATYRLERDPRILLTLDVDDHIDPSTREWLTLDEEGRIVRTPEHEARAAEIGLRVEAWRGQQEFNAEQARWASLIGRIGRRIMADAMQPEPFDDYDLDEHPFDALGGYDQARHVFGGTEALGDLIAGFNTQVLGAGAGSGPSVGGPAG